MITRPMHRGLLLAYLVAVLVWLLPVVLRHAHPEYVGVGAEPLWMLDGLGIEHGIDLDKVADTSSWLADHLGRPSPSAVVRALRG